MVLFTWLAVKSVLISEDKVTYKQEKMHSRNDKLTKQVVGRRTNFIQFALFVQISTFHSYQHITKYTVFYQTKGLKVRLGTFCTKNYFAMSDPIVSIDTLK